MSITLESMCPIYKSMLPHFITLAEEAKHYGVSFEVCVSPEGNITFNSKEIDNDVMHFNTISQGTNHVGESSFNYTLGNKRIERG